MPRSLEAVDVGDGVGEKDRCSDQSYDERKQPKQILWKLPLDFEDHDANIIAWTM